MLWDHLSGTIGNWGACLYSDCIDRCRTRYKLCTLTNTHKSLDDATIFGFKRVEHSLQVIEKLMRHSACRRRSLTFLVESNFHFDEYYMLPQEKSNYFKGWNMATKSDDLDSV